MERMFEVSIQRCTPNSSNIVVEEAVRSAMDLIGGIEKYVSRGDKVLLKPNLVCDVSKYPYAFLNGSNSFGTDSRIVAALVKICKEAGTDKIAVGECEDYIDKYNNYGYKALCKKLNVPLLDFNVGPYLRFQIPDGYVYKEVFMNANIIKFDKIVSCAKLKVHSVTGVSLTMKNLFGLMPTRYYSSEEEQLRRGVYFAWRNLLHREDPQLGKVLPYTIVDFYQACPIDLAVIDGMVGSNRVEHIKGEPVEVDVIIAGNNAVATDAVGTAVMDFDPKTEMPNMPFLYGRNHLNLATAKNLGTNIMSNINVRGETVEKVKKPFVVDISVRQKPQKQKS
jgi:uncharacterized protein (DUF362 family)